MRVTIILPTWNLSGGVRVAAIYAEQLGRRGHEVRVVTPPNRRDSPGRRVVSMLRGRRETSDMGGQASHLEGRDISHAVAKHRPVGDSDLPDADVVVATWWETAEWVAALSPEKGSKAYFIQHHEVHSHLPVDRVRATYRLPMHKIVVASWLKNIMRQEYDDEDVSCVPNSVDTEQFHASPRGKSEPVTVGMTYSATEYKGCDVGLEAVSLARLEYPELRVVLFGGKAPTTDCDLPEGAEFHLAPEQGRLRHLYGRCDAWLVPSRSEGFGLPILEAMACRTPVIATPTGAAPELVGGGAGILVGLDNPPEMARAIVRVARMSDGEWRSMSEKAHRTATAYSWEDATDLFEAALERAVEKQGG